MLSPPKALIMFCSVICLTTLSFLWPGRLLMLHRRSLFEPLSTGDSRCGLSGISHTGTDEMTQRLGYGLKDSEEARSAT